MNTSHTTIANTLTLTNSNRTRTRVRKSLAPFPRQEFTEHGAVDALSAVPEKAVASAPELSRCAACDDIYHLYLREIGQIKLLTREEEFELACRVQRGDEAARERMITANLRLVVKIARDFESFGLPLLDLINEGNIGLMKAVERFDPARNVRLCAYASFWIKQAIRRALANQTKTIRLPVHVQEKLLHIRRAAVKLQEALGHEPTDDELGAEVGLPGAKVRKWRDAVRPMMSLDESLGQDSGHALGEALADPRASTPYEQLESSTVRQLLHEFVKELNHREATIVRQRFGLDGEPEKTLEEVGAELGLTRERIRQLQEVALRKLRAKISARDAVHLAA